MVQELVDELDHGVVAGEKALLGAHIAAHPLDGAIEAAVTWKIVTGSDRDQ